MRKIDGGWMAEARILAILSFSITVTMLAQLAISTVETLIVARLGIQALAGMTLALGIYFLVFLFSLGVVTAITPIAAQARGRGDRDGLRRSGQQGLWVGLSFSLPGTTLLLACGWCLDRLPGSGPEAGIASAYLLGAAWGLPAWVSYVAVRCLAVATDRVGITTAAMLGSVPLHAGLTWWLVFGGFGLPPQGVWGAGVAYSLTAFGALGLLALMLRNTVKDDFASVFRRPVLWDGTCYREIIRLGLPLACRILLSEGVLPVAALAIAPFGASAVTAHAVAARVAELTGIFSFGLSDAAGMRVSYSVGAGLPHQAERAGWIAIQLSVLINALVALALLLEPGLVAYGFLGDADPAGVAVAALLLPIVGGLQILEGVRATAGGALNGLRDTQGPLLITIAGSWMVGLPLGLLLAWTTAVPVQGLWMGLTLGSGLSATLCLLRFRQKIARRKDAR